jgi:hypothetical protein
MPARQRDFLAPADTTAVGTATTVDANLCQIVLAKGIVLLAESAGMDESRFHSHFNENLQVCCASGKKCENSCPVKESSHRCGGYSLLFYSQLTCATKKLSELAGADGFTKAMLPPYGQAKYAQYKGVWDLALLDICYSCQERNVSELELNFLTDIDSANAMQEGAQSVASIGTSLKAANDIMAAALSCIVWEDIVVGAGSDNKVNNKIARPTFTQLEGIRVDGVVHPTQELMVIFYKSLPSNSTYQKQGKMPRRQTLMDLYSFELIRKGTKGMGPLTLLSQPTFPSSQIPSVSLM